MAVPIKIAIFNHKGGVGKTTLTANIAAAIGERGHEVLLIDSDPQCNLTSYMFDEETVDNWLDKSDSPAGETIWSAIRPFIDSTGKVEPLAPYETKAKNCYILPGDIQLSQFELDLATCWAECKAESRRGFNGTALLTDLANRYGEDYDFDYVFFDTGPNIGPLNRSILLGCDYFIIPGACDLFSVRALKTLGVTLAKWIRTWRTISNDAPSRSSVLSGSPKYLGYIPQNFRIYGSVMSSQAARYHSRFVRQLRVDVLDQLRAVDTELAPSSVSGTKLGEIRDFSSLVQKAQEQNVPLWKVYGGQQYQQDDAKSAFAGMAESIIDKTEGGE